MSTHRSYFSKNNTLVSNTLANTGRNPITDLYFGSNDMSISPTGFSRFLFDIDLWHKANEVIKGTKYWIGCEIIGKILRKL